MAKVEIYTKHLCPYCMATKSLLKKKNVDYIEIVAASDREKRKEMNDRSGRNTFPQTFINGQHIGGNDDLQALEKAGELDALLSA